MSVANYALMKALQSKVSRLQDNLAALVAATQATATPLVGDCNRVVTSVATGSVILPSILTGEAEPLTFVVNDSPNSINIYPATGETINALAANTAIALAAGLSAICVMNGVPGPTGGGATASNQNWRIAAIP